MKSDLVKVRRVYVPQSSDGVGFISFETAKLQDHLNTPVGGQPKNLFDIEYKVVFHNGTWYKLVPVTDIYINDDTPEEFRERNKEIFEHKIMLENIR